VKWRVWIMRRHLPAAGGHGPDLGQLAVALGFHGVGGLAFGQHLGLVGGQLVGERLPALAGGPVKDLIAAGTGRRPLVSQLVK
jgi:hypothetical protein